MKPGSYLLIHERAARLDWQTYPIWRHYTVTLDDGRTVKCRSSDLPGMMAGAGAAMLAIVAVTVLVPRATDIPWGFVIPVAFVGCLLCAPIFALMLTPWRLMVALGRPISVNTSHLDRMRDK